MKILNYDTVVESLRPHLADYLTHFNILEPNTSRFSCLVHEDKNPSMSLNVRNNGETAHCFSCGANIDLFSAAAIIENLPSSGEGWLAETIPHLAAMFGIDVSYGERSLEEIERSEQYKLVSDITDILAGSPNDEYAVGRGWIPDYLDVTGSISPLNLQKKLMERGWSSQEISTNPLTSLNYPMFFGEDLFTFAIRDHKKRPIAFVSRQLDPTKKPKYINTPETQIYKKRSVLMGLDVAKESSRGSAGLYIVEGPGDMAQLRRMGIPNVAATCGTALTKEHINLVKTLGIKHVRLCLDWDNAGTLAVSRILSEVILGITGIHFSVIRGPRSGEKDVDELLRKEESVTRFLELEEWSAFEWTIHSLGENISPEEISHRVIPVIAAEPSAIRREMLIKQLMTHTGFSFSSIDQDVSNIRNAKSHERRERLKSSAARYISHIEDDSDNTLALLANHENEINSIEQEYNKQFLGVDYQLSRYDAIQDKRNEDTLGDINTFEMRYYRNFKHAFDGGASWTTGTLIYFGGHANGGKTATIMSIGMDILVSDPNAIVIIHSTDDSYEQIEPRLKTTINLLITGVGALTIGGASNPRNNIKLVQEKEAYEEASAILRKYILEGKLIVIDSEDGATLTTLEKVIRYVKRESPNKKILVIQDNVHNLLDHPTIDKTSRMTLISTGQKNLAVKYGLCLMSTAEYRKDMHPDRSKLRLPIDDDLADARALTYRPNAIIHVYNDLHARKDDAEVFWTHPTSPNQALPRLWLVISKNKISSYKNKLVMDLDTRTVTIRPKHLDEAMREYADPNRGEIINGYVAYYDNESNNER